MKKNHTLRNTLIVCCTVAAVIAGIVLFFAKRQPNKIVEVVPVGNVSTSYWGDNQTLDGYVTEGSTQEVTMTEGGFARIAVKEGDAVRKGTTLVEYDNTQSELTLRGDEAKIASIKATIALAEKTIEDKLKLKNSIQTKLTAWEKEIATAPEGGSTVTDFALIKTVNEVNADTVGKSFKQMIEDAEKTAVRYNCISTTMVTEDFLTEKSLRTTDDPYFICLDVYAIAVDPGTQPEWQARWTLTTESLKQFFKGTPPTVPWVVGDGLIFGEDGYLIGIAPEKLAGYGALSFTFPQDLVDLPDDTSTDGMPQTPQEAKERIEEINKEISALKESIEASNLKLRKAQITYEKDKLTYQAGKVVAAIDGTVTLVNSDKATPIGEAVVRVQGASNYAVTLYVNELMLGTVKIGSTVQLQCYESGTMTSAQISDVNTTPVTGYYGGGNLNASTYQVTAEISDPAVQPRLGEWCQATLGSEPTQADMDALYLPLFLVREDDGGSYVMRTDENERLQKQYITTGKTVWGSYIEIKHGVTSDDHLAFPYGNTVREGAPVKHVDFFNY